MAITYNVAVKEDRLDATRAYFANGTLEILTAGDVLLATFGLNALAGSVTGAVWTLGFDATTVQAVASGAAAKAQIKTAGGLAHLTGLTVGTSAADLIVDNTNIATGQNVTINAATITHAA